MFTFLFTNAARVGGTVYDIHCHIIPNVDDGSGSLNDSVEMAQIAVQSGIKGIIATPHCNIPEICENYWSLDFDKKTEQLNNKLKQKDIPLTVYPGQEIYVDGDVVSHLKNGKLITLNNSRYVLIEFDFNTPEMPVYETIKKLLLEGYVPIVAHPERYTFTYENFQSIIKMRSIGALIQLNGGSIKGSFGLYPMQVSKYILENQFADFVASDAHSQYSRTPDLTTAHEIVCANYSYEYADLLFNKNPFNVINNKEIR